MILNSGHVEDVHQVEETGLKGFSDLAIKEEPCSLQFH